MGATKKYNNNNDDDSNDPTTVVVETTKMTRTMAIDHHHDHHDHHGHHDHQNTIFDYYESSSLFRIEEKIRQQQKLILAASCKASYHEKQAKETQNELQTLNEQVTFLQEMIDEYEDTIQNLSTQQEQQKGIISSLKSGILFLDRKEGELILRKIQGLEENFVSGNKTNNNDHKDDDAMHHNSQNFSRKGNGDDDDEEEVFFEYISNEENEPKPTNHIQMPPLCRITSAHWKPGAVWKEYIKKDLKGILTQEMVLQQKLADCKQPPPPSVVVLKEFTQKELPRGTLTQDMILQAFMKRKDPKVA